MNQWYYLTAVSNILLCTDYWYLITVRTNSQSKIALTLLHPIANAHLLLKGGCRQWWRLWHLGWRGRRVWVWGRGEIQMYVQKYRNTYAKLMWWSIKRRWNTRKLRSKKTNSFFEGERLAWPWGDTERVWRPLLQSDAQGTVGYAPKYTQICPNMSNMLKQFKYAQKCKIHPNMPKFSPSITCAQNPGSNRGQPDRYWQRRQLVQPTKEEVNSMTILIIITSQGK